MKTVYNRIDHKTYFGFRKEELIRIMSIKATTLDDIRELELIKGYIKQMDLERLSTGIYIITKKGIQFLEDKEFIALEKVGDEE